jgi:1-aminocyclopropane-1-carboxylate deaminase
MQSAMQLKQTPIMPFNSSCIKLAGITLSIKRDDQQHEIISGNKLFKLFYHLEKCQQLGVKTIVTFGGAYSNHVHATAYAAKQMGIKVVAIIRGELLLPLNPTLKDCVDWGMIIEPVNRQEYKIKGQSEIIQKIIAGYENPYVIPEGGSDLLGVKGAAKILEGVDQSRFDYIVCACGTGTTVSGIIQQAASHIHVLGMAVLKGASWMHEEVQGWLNKLESEGVNSGEAIWSINTDYHFGGYAKTSGELDAFIDQINQIHSLPLEHIYTGKALYGVLDLAEQGFFKLGSRILFIHTGGLQGARGKGVQMDTRVRE